MLIENLKNFSDIKLNYETRRELFNMYNKWLKVELEVRKLIFEGEFNDDLELLSKHVFSFKDRDSILEDRFECTICVNLCHISLIKCSACKKIY